METQQTEDRRLLIVEDDPIVAAIYQRAFERDGYRVEICSDGRAGFYRLHEARFSAVLLDLMLPQMNGLDILGKIRAQKQFGNLPVMVLTNAHLGQMANKAAAAGANRVFLKSKVTPDTVLAAVNALVSPGRSQGDDIQEDNAVPASPLEQNESSLADDSQSPNCPKLPKADAFRDEPNFTKSTPGPALPTSAVGTAAPADDELTPAELSSLEQSGAAMLDMEQQVKDMRRWLKEVQTASNPERRLNGLRKMVRSVHFITSPDLSTDIPMLARLAEAFEALLWELTEQPTIINASTLMTLSKTADFVAYLVAARPEMSPDLQASVLVLDDDPFSRRAMIKAMEKVGISPVVMDNPLSALECLQTTAFDLVITDVNMPEMTGFDLCKKMRGASPNRTTPVIFVTVLDDFQARVQSALSGGNEYIGKPYLLIELAVKSLVHIFKSRTAPAGRPPAPARPGLRSVPVAT